MVRLVNPDGGTLLITLVESLVRLWSRARRPMSRRWVQDHASLCIWGNRRGYSSSFSAYEHNLQAEIADRLGECSITVFLDMWKCFETVMYDALNVEARSMRFPMGLLGVLLGSCSQPRVIRAFGCWSKSFRALQ
eukprot:3410684-Pyramimonas_sp.AAC.1